MHYVNLGITLRVLLLLINHIYFKRGWGVGLKWMSICQASKDWGSVCGGSQVSDIYGGPLQPASWWTRPKCCLVLRKHFKSLSLQRADFPHLSNRNDNNNKQFRGMLWRLQELHTLSLEGSPLLLNLEPSEKRSWQRWSCKGRQENMALDLCLEGWLTLPWNWQSYTSGHRRLWTGASLSARAGTVQGSSPDGMLPADSLVHWERETPTERTTISQMNQSDKLLLGVLARSEEVGGASPQVFGRHGCLGKQVERRICVPPHTYRALLMIPGRQTLINVHLTLLTIMLAMSNSTPEAGKSLSHTLS